MLEFGCIPTQQMQSLPTFPNLQSYPGVVLTIIQTQSFKLTKRRMYRQSAGLCYVPPCAEKNLLTSNAAHSVKLTEIPGKRGSNPSMFPGELIYLPNAFFLCFEISMKSQSKREKLAFLLLENSLLWFCFVDFNQCLPTSSLVYTESNKRATMAIPKTHRNNF